VRAPKSLPLPSIPVRSPIAPSIPCCPTVVFCSISSTRPSPATRLNASRHGRVFLARSARPGHRQCHRHAGGQRNAQSDRRVAGPGRARSIESRVDGQRSTVPCQKAHAGARHTTESLLTPPPRSGGGWEGDESAFPCSHMSLPRRLSGFQTTTPGHLRG